VDSQAVCNIIDDEEKRFLRTLEKAEKFFKKEIDKLPAESKRIPGDVAWLLYNTYGFPIDLTQLMAEEKGLQVDLERFESLRADASVCLFELLVLICKFLETHGNCWWKVWHEMILFC
jgi:alanyl-tRNA synthetase